MCIDGYWLKFSFKVAALKLLLRSVGDTPTFVFCCWIAIQQLLLANVRYPQVGLLQVESSWCTSLEMHLALLSLYIQSLIKYLHNETRVLPPWPTPTRSTHTMYLPSAEGVDELAFVEVPICGDRIVVATMHMGDTPFPHQQYSSEGGQVEPGSVHAWNTRPEEFDGFTMDVTTRTQCDFLSQHKAVKCMHAKDYFKST